MDFNFLIEKVATGENQTYLDWIISGAGYTVAVSGLAFILALALGILVGSLRTTTGIKKKLADTYFEVVRSVPFLAQVFIGYFVLPVILFPEAVKTMNPDSLIFAVGTLSLGVYMSSRIAAQVTAGIQALPRSQGQAAKALGFNQVQTYSKFLVPQALRNIAPSLTSEAMNTVKNSAVISTIGLLDLTKQAQTIIDYTAKPFEAFACILIGYLIINFSVKGLAYVIEKKTKLA